MTQYSSPTALRPLSTRSENRSFAQTAALVLGIAFLAVGIAGFIPGITQNVGDMKFAGHESGAELLGVFQVSVLHNLVHVLFGVIGLVAAKRYKSSRNYLILGGIAYLVLLVFGLSVGYQSDANFVPLDDADNWLHLGLGAGMILLGVVLGDREHAHVGAADDRSSRTV